MKDPIFRIKYKDKPYEYIVRVTEINEKGVYGCFLLPSTDLFGLSGVNSEGLWAWDEIEDPVIILGDQKENILRIFEDEAGNQPFERENRQFNLTVVSEPKARPPYDGQAILPFPNSE